MTAAKLEFRVLGSIEVRRDGRAARLSGRKTRSVLAALLLRANQIVPSERLVAVVWGEQPPATAVAQVHKCVSQLRARLGSDRILRSGSGYTLRVAPDELDLRLFDRALWSARAALAAGEPAKALADFRRALALWRGEPLADGTEELIRSEAPALEERRVAAMLERIDTELLLGRHAGLIGELRALVADHPLREPLRGRLMLALYRSGRVAEALSTYHAGRELLADELGLDPGPDLRRLHEAILSADPALDAPPPGAARTPPPAPARPPCGAVPPPAQLPPSIADFTGRKAEVELLGDILTTTGGDAPALVAISGKGGVGKTALAVYAARRLRDAFPDGHLFVRLRDAQGRPLDPLVALKRFLRALGVEDEAIPDNRDECTQLFRSRSAELRMLVLLDDAADEAQVRPLLPGSPTCAVLITSWRRLLGLESARHLALDVFTPGEAEDLLERIVGRPGPGEDRAPLREIAELCGRLPLAVRIAATRFARHSPGDLARFARRLADERRRLDVLVAGDLEVRASFAIGYQGLGAREREAFCLLSLLDAPDFAAWVVAPLLEVSVYEAEDLVERLVTAQLLDIAGRDAMGRTRYRFHDLVRLFARERAAAELPEPARRAALARALGGWLALAAEADARLHGAGLPGLSDGRTPWNRFDPADVEDLLRSPLGWFTAERHALAGAVAQAGRLGGGLPAWPLAAALTGFLELRHLHADWEETHTRALESCLADGDRFGAVVMLLRLARLRCVRKEPAVALDLADSAAAALGGETPAALRAEYHLVRAAALRSLGAYDRALDEAHAATAQARAAGDRLAEARAARMLGTVRHELAQWGTAADALRRAARLCRLLGNRREEALAQRRLAVVLRHIGRYAEARQLAEAALAAFRELGDRPYEALSRLTLGLVLRKAGDPAGHRLFDEGYAMLERMNLRHDTGEALYARAALELSEGRAEEAIDQLLTAVGILGADPVDGVLVSATETLARALRVTGRTEAADAVRARLPELCGHMGRPVPAGCRASVAAAAELVRTEHRRPERGGPRTPVMLPA